MIKDIHIVVSLEEYKRLLAIKRQYGFRTWKDMLLALSKSPNDVKMTIINEAFDKLRAINYTLAESMRVIFLKSLELDERVVNDIIHDALDKVINIANSNKANQELQER